MQDLNLAVIGNCTLGALVDRWGRYVWCCYPRLDGDLIFCNLLRDVAGDGLFDVEIARLTSSHQYCKRFGGIWPVQREGEGESQGTQGHGCVRFTARK